jgi:hypothetical protein
LPVCAFISSNVTSIDIGLTGHDSSVHPTNPARAD